MMIESRGSGKVEEEEEEKNKKNPSTLYFITPSEKKTSKGGKLYCK